MWFLKVFTWFRVGELTLTSRAEKIESIIIKCFTPQIKFSEIQPLTSLDCSPPVCLASEGFILHFLAFQSPSNYSPVASFLIFSRHLLSSLFSPLKWCCQSPWMRVVCRMSHVQRFCAWLLALQIIWRTVVLLCLRCCLCCLCGWRCDSVSLCRGYKLFLNFLFCCRKLQTQNVKVSFFSLGLKKHLRRIFFDGAAEIRSVSSCN